MKILFTSVFVCCAATAHAAPVNGDFSDGLNGYTLEACGFTCDRPTDPFFSIETNGSDPYLEVNSSTTLLGVTQAGASQDIAITDDAHILTFDAVQFETLNDPGSSGKSLFGDALSILVSDARDNFYFLFEFIAGGPDFNPFSQPEVAVTETQASDDFFDVGVRADLSAFKGQTLTLGIFAFSESDGSILFGGFDNFALTGTPQPQVPTVPLPAGFSLMLAILAGFSLLRRRTPT